MTRGLTAGRVLTYAVLALWSVVCLFPIYWLAVTSLKPAAAVEAGPHYIPFVDFRPYLGAWRFILLDERENLVSTLINSAIIAAGAAALGLLAGSMAAYSLGRFVFRSPFSASPANGALMFAILATRILPPIVLAVPLYAMARVAGLLDTRSFLVVVYAAVNLPLAIWLMAAAIGHRPSDQEDAARLDGASHVTVLFSVLLPMHRGAVAATALILFILSWNEYLFAASLATNDAATVPVWLAGQLSMKEAQVVAEGEELARFSAAAALLTLPLLGLAAFIQRALRRGLLGRGGDTLLAAHPIGPPGVSRRRLAAGSPPRIARRLH